MFLVVGATGDLGSRIVHRLVRDGLVPSAAWSVVGPT